MMEIKVCKDVRQYRESIVMGLTLRQVICSVGAIVVAVGLFFGLKTILGIEIASWACIVGASPIAIAGFFNYNSLTIEKFVKELIKTNFLRNGVRLWVGENYYYNLWRNINDKNTKKQYAKREIPKWLATKNSPRKHTNKTFSFKRGTRTP